MKDSTSSFNSNVFLVCSTLIAIKCSLLFCYTSTDFEVHRNWKSITRHLPLQQWYYEDRNECTLDYPPFFAYFECILGWFAEKIDPKVVVLQSEPFMNLNTLLFQRFSVIFCDILFYIGCVVLAKNTIKSIDGLTFKLNERLKFGLFCFLVLNPSLILLDNIHFQYNSMMYGLFFCSIGLILRGNLLFGALLFSVLLNFKHIYVYYAPSFIGFYLTSYLFPLELTFIQRAIKLGSSIALPLIFSFGPFIYTGGVECLQQILTRLFPFKQRGLTHSYWAPNFWALYNFVDYLLNRIVRLFHKQLPIPKYTSGIVQVYDHTVLPNISPLITHLLVLLSLTSLIPLFCMKRQNKFLIATILSSFAFFLFSYHVHEKALILVFVPYTILAFKEPKLVSNYLLLSMCTVVTQFPLIYDIPVENLIKYSLAIFYMAFQLTTFKLIFGLPFEITMSWTNRIFMFLFISLELYKSIVHRIVFADKADFLPLMATSVLCSLGVHLLFLQFLYHIFGQSIQLSIAKRLCLWEEAKIKASNNSTLNLEDVKLIAGLDTSTCKHFDGSLAVVSCTVCSYSDLLLDVVYSKDELCLLQYDYFPDFLSLRELKPLERILRKLARDYSIDLLLIDANGTFHQRGCGLASQIGHSTGIPSIGVAKNFGRSALHSFGIDGKKADQFESIVKEECKKCSNEYDTAFELQHDGQPFLIVYRSAQSTMPVYLSPGYGISWDDLLEIAPKCMIGSACYPIRISDIQSRAFCKKLLDEGCQGVVE